MGTNKTANIRVLILGGTGDAAQLAARLANIPHVQAIASLAGRTHQPTIPAGDVRIGGFGGVQGLADYLREMKIDLLIDATHPFAQQISANAAEAAIQVAIPRLMLVRPPWSKVAGDRWIEVENIAIAADVLENSAQRVFLTIGRQELAAFSHLQNIWFLMRIIDPPNHDVVLPPGILLSAKGPFSLDNERQILRQYNIDLIVSKNSGGDATYAKVIAARELGIKIVMVQRPPIPEGEQVPDVEGAIKWILCQM